MPLQGHPHPSERGLAEGLAPLHFLTAKRLFQGLRQQVSYKLYLSEFVLEPAADGADPGIGQFLERGSGRYVALRVTFLRIVNIAADCALIFCHSIAS